MEELSRHFYTSAEEVKRYVLQAEADFEVLFRNSACQWSIGYTDRTPVLSFYRFRDAAIISTNTHRPEKPPVINLLATRGGDLYNFAVGTGTCSERFRYDTYDRHAQK